MAGKAENNYYLDLYKKGLPTTGQFQYKKELFLSIVSSKRPKTAFLGPLVSLYSVLEIFPSVSDVSQN